MELAAGPNKLVVAQDPFRLVFSRAGRILLRSTPDFQPATLERTDGVVTVKLPVCVLRIAIQKDGFVLQAKGPCSLAFELSGHWYGYGELLHQRLPLNRLMLPLSPLLTYDNGPAGQSCKLTPAWYSSQGALVMAHSPVAVGLNQPPPNYPRYTWSLGADKGPFAHRPFMDCGAEGDGLLTLQGVDLHLSIFLGDHAVAAFEKLVQVVGFPGQMPPAELFAQPTWTTWARYKTEISQEVVLAFAEDIIRQGFPYGVMEIDDRWQSHYGDLAFDPKRFPEAPAMIARLHQQGFKVTTWVIPFLDPASEAFSVGRENGYLVRQKTGEPYLVSWWQGWGGLLDVTNPAALEWFLERLYRLQAQSGLDGYKFDAGEACFLPADAVTNEAIHPNQYTQRYVEFASRHFRLTEVRSGWLNQPAPVFFRQWDKSSTWGADNGLHSVVTGILALGLTGYPFILPDMIGGNAYDHQAEAELMIRWAQLNALLPAMQFSLAPWDYGESCIELCRQAAVLHLEFAPQILEAAREATRTGRPLVRPIWWLDPTDEQALLCDDQFLLGDDILVAPVLAPGARARDIYLPVGVWRDYRRGGEFQGRRVHRNYHAPLEVLPIFLRQV